MANIKEEILIDLTKDKYVGHIKNGEKTYGMLNGNQLSIRSSKEIEKLSLQMRFDEIETEEEEKICFDVLGKVIKIACPSIPDKELAEIPIMDRVTLMSVYLNKIGYVKKKQEKSPK